VTLTNYGAFLAAHPPTHEAQIHQGTSWSCAHGVERWRADCGCRVRGDWHQRWRAPLREALDWLRDAADALYETRGGALFKDPWQARDEYVDVILEHRRERLERFLATHLRVAAEPAVRLEARRLLELQRNRLLMYTSCGWFFDEISGIEPVQILRYAAMTLQYVQDLGGGQLEPEFLRRLSAAPSNVASFGDGGEVYRRLVAPAVVDLRRVLAHYAITGLTDDQPDDTAVYAYHVRRLDEARSGYGTTALRIGHVEVESDVTGESREAAYALLHFGGHDFSCALQAWESRAAYDRMKDDLLQRYARYSLADMVRGIDDYFRGETFGLPHLFLEERRRVLARVVDAALEKHEAAYRRIWEENRKLVRYLRQADAPIPEALAIVARHVLEQEALDALAEVERTGTLSEALLETVAEASALGLTLDLSAAKPTMQAAVERALEAVAADPTPERLTAAVRLISDARSLGLRFGLWAAQNRFFDIWRARRDARPRLGPLGAALGFKLAVETP
jgi:alpha-amylase/alpha-mannosidase (GH57 family)